jgi:drug/metabolite transporter (DMT)-like permease
MTLYTFSLVVLSAMLHAGWNVVAKRHSGNYSIICLSFCLGFALCLPMAWPHFSNDVNWNAVLPLILLTGSLHAIYGFLLSFTYHNGDISTLYPIVRGSGIVGSVLLGIILLGERLPWQAIGGIIIVILGIVLLSFKRNRNATSMRGVLLALLSGAFIMSYTVLDKVIVGTVHPLVLMACSQIISAIMFLPYVLLRRREEFVRTVRTLWPSVIAVAVPALASYLIILHAFQVAPIGRIVAVREVSVAFGAVTGYIWLKEDLSRTRVIGVFVVVLGILLVKLF